MRLMHEQSEKPLSGEEPAGDAEGEYSHFRCPKGEEGHSILEHMNQHHRELTDWALSFLDGAPASTALDIGCGGGMALSRIAALYPRAQLHGVDLSEEAIRCSAETNAEAMAEGRLYLQVASVAELPFPDERFDLVSAFETYFFWPNLEDSVAEACRTVAPGGTILIVSESYPNLFFRRINERNRRLYGVNVVENHQMKAMLEAAGMSVETKTKKLRNWVCFIGRKAVISS